MKASALFIFAHQDDEFGVFQAIIDEQARGRRVYCAYLTDGVAIANSSQQRNAESIAVLTKLGVRETDIIFAGDMLAVPDGSLHNHLKAIHAWMLKWFAEHVHITTIYVLAWEGGHPDHDALHAVCVYTAQQVGLLDIVKQFPLYNGYRCPSSFFRVLLPLPENGVCITSPISWRNRIQFLRHCLSYPSQITTWIGLFPFVLMHYFISGKQALQPVSLARIFERPHQGSLYYEKRKFCTWGEMRAKLSIFDHL